MSLRTRLLLAVLACVAAGLLVAGVITYVSLRGFLLERVDAQLRDGASRRAMALERTDTGRAAFGRRPGRRTCPPGTYGQLRDSPGSVLIAGASPVRSRRTCRRPCSPTPSPPPATRATASSSP